MARLFIKPLSGLVLGLAVLAPTFVGTASAAPPKKPVDIERHSSGKITGSIPTQEQLGATAKSLANLERRIGNYAPESAGYQSMHESIMAVLREACRGKYLGRLMDAVVVASRRWPHLSISGRLLDRLAGDPEFFGEVLDLPAISEEIATIPEVSNPPTRQELSALAKKVIAAEKGASAPVGSLIRLASESVLETILQRALRLGYMDKLYAAISDVEFAESGSHGISSKIWDKVKEGVGAANRADRSVIASPRQRTIIDVTGEPLSAEPFPAEPAPSLPAPTRGALPSSPGSTTQQPSGHYQKVKPPTEAKPWKLQPQGKSKGKSSGGGKGGSGAPPAPSGGTPSGGAPPAGAGAAPVVRPRATAPSGSVASVVGKIEGVAGRVGGPLTVVATFVQLGNLPDEIAANTVRAATANTYGDGALEFFVKLGVSPDGDREDPKYNALFNAAVAEWEAKNGKVKDKEKAKEEEFDVVGGLLSVGLPILDMIDSISGNGAVDVERVDKGTSGSSPVKEAPVKGVAPDPSGGPGVSGVDKDFAPGPDGPSAPGDSPSAGGDLPTAGVPVTPGADTVAPGSGATPGGKEEEGDSDGSYTVTDGTMTVEYKDGNGDKETKSVEGGKTEKGSVNTDTTTEKSDSEDSDPNKDNSLVNPFDESDGGVGGDRARVALNKSALATAIGGLISLVSSERGIGVFDLIAEWGDGNPEEPGGPPQSLLAALGGLLDSALGERDSSAARTGALSLADLGADWGDGGGADDGGAPGGPPDEAGFVLNKDNNGYDGSTPDGPRGNTNNKGATNHHAADPGTRRSSLSVDKAVQGGSKVGSAQTQAPTTVSLTQKLSTWQTPKAINNTGPATRIQGPTAKLQSPTTQQTQTLTNINPTDSKQYGE